jgi:hypothetical protein
MISTKKLLDNIRLNFSKFLQGEYNSESAFDKKKIFEWLVDYLKATKPKLDSTTASTSNGSNSSVSNRIFILDKRYSTGRSVGFARQVVLNKELLLTRPFQKDEDIPTSICDHACVIFEDNKIKNVTAIVEIKMNDSSCSNFVKNSITKLLPNPKLRSSHGALSQVLKYAFSIWQCMVTYCIFTEKIPFLILAGKRKNAGKQKRKTIFQMTTKIQVLVKLCLCLRHFGFRKY